MPRRKIVRRVVDQNPGRDVAPAEVAQPTEHLGYAEDSPLDGDLGIDRSEFADLFRVVLGGLATLVRSEVRRAVKEAVATAPTAVEDTHNLTAHELADKLKVHVETVYRWSRQSGFPRKRVGPHAVRFDLADVLAWRGRESGEP